MQVKGADISILLVCKDSGLSHSRCLYGQDMLVDTIGWLVAEKLQSLMAVGQASLGGG